MVGNWQRSSHEWTRGEREVYIGSKGLMFKYVGTMRESTFVTGKANLTTRISGVLIGS